VIELLPEAEIKKGEMSLQFFCETLAMLEEVTNKLATSLERDLDAVFEPGRRFDLKGVASVCKKTVANLLEDRPDEYFLELSDAQPAGGKGKKQKQKPDKKKKPEPGPANPYDQFGENPMHTPDFDDDALSPLFMDPNTL
jgi:hypothetical protein